MKNFKLFLFGGVFCSLIVSTAVAVERTCADEMPTCAELGYKWDCKITSSYSDHMLECPWDPTKKYCPAATAKVSGASDTSNEKVDYTRRDCVALGFDNDAGDCPYNYIPCPFDQSKVFCAVPSGPIYNPPASSGGTVNSSGITAGSGNSAVAGGINRP